MLHSPRNSWAQPRSLPRGRLAAIRCLPEALATVALTRLALTFSSLARVRARSLPEAVSGRRDAVEVARVAWSVRVASVLVPFASCLTQAQACQIILARRGIESALCLGVRPASEDAFEAHAWVVYEGKLILGGAPERIATFRPLTQLGPAR